MSATPTIVKNTIHVDPDIIRGTVPILKTELDIWRTAGLDGYGAQRTGKADAEFDLVTIFYCTTAGVADSMINSAFTLQGELVSVTDNWGVVSPNVLVRHIDTAIKKAMKFAKAGTFYPSGVRLEMHWNCLVAA